MGMFDELRLEKPVICACGNAIKTVQTKHFDNALSLYSVGDVVMDGTDTHIFKEELYCENCRNISGYVYLIIKNGILIGTKTSIAEAEARLEKFDELDFLELYNEVARRKELYYSNYKELRSRLEHLIQWYNKTPEEQEESKGGIFDFFYNEFYNKDILAALHNILREVKRDEFNISREFKHNYRRPHNS